MLALVDANSFYASCHQIFRPELEGKPIIVLSNRDGNVVARSAQAKALGIKMGQPFFETRELVDQHDVVVFSSNYELYGDISSRLMSLLTQFAPDVEVYSIDEAFLQLEEYTGIYPSYQGLGLSIRESMKQWLRLPVGVGIGPTKTLAKVANRLAKIKPELNGVCVLDSQEAIDEALWGFPIEDVWGVGGKSVSKLKKQGIRTAYQLREVNDDWIQRVMTVNGLRLVHELRGMPCKLLDVNPPPRKAICTEPGFGKVIPDLDTITDALTVHLSRICEKLRKQESLCGTVTVWLRTNPHRRTPGNFLPAKQYSNSVTVRLPHPTSSTLEIIKYAASGLKAIFKFGYNYQRVGIMLTDLVPADYRQMGVFTQGPDERLIRLSAVIDKVNKRYGQDKLRLASQMYNPEWPMKPSYLSPRYTTRWEDILEAH
ncbi:Y-family DNA polymerase [Spirosoma pollinicola]|uniref:DNA polymerase V subunit UmuC n=1 Tax=Spirosoma pollinicola TaxID=2057025 RepID=A0A2K8YV58_9BACT|nr:Y-family DNA polymerase [Spirosoma pollinicola]AUD01448.1 DNA polymerase V subunit UmuC [Spirosoma pollinicola]